MRRGRPTQALCDVEIEVAVCSVTNRDDLPWTAYSTILVPNLGAGHLDLPVEPALVLHGKFVGPGGEPLSRARVAVDPDAAGASPFRAAISDDSGRVTLVLDAEAVGGAIPIRASLADGTSGMTNADSQGVVPFVIKITR